jgi:hypothetical protein
MQTTATTTTQANALLAGSILEEYRDVLLSHGLEAGRPLGAVADASGDPQCGDQPDNASGDPQCEDATAVSGDPQCQSILAQSRNTRSWIDLPRA